MKSRDGAAVWQYVRIALGAILIFSGIMKFTDLTGFGEAILKFRLLNHLWVPYVKVIIPSIEIGIGIMLITNYKTFFASQAAGWMLAFFTALLIAKIFEGEKISCKCFGSLTSGNIDWSTVLRNLIMMAAAIGITTFYTPKTGSAGKSKKTPGFFDRIAGKEWYGNLKKNLAVTLFFFLAVQSIILSLQNAGLKDNLSLLMMNNETIQPGDKAPDIEAAEINGNKTVLNLTTGKYSLIYIFSTKCEPCKTNLPNWIKLTDLLKDKGINITGIGVNSPEELQKFTTEHKPNFRIISGDNLKFKSDYKAYTTPQTIVIGKDGKFIKSYPGILNSVNIQKLLWDMAIKLE